MGKPALYGVPIFGISVGFFLLSVAVLMLSDVGLSEYGALALQVLRISGLVAFASLLLIGIDFAFLSEWGRAKRRILYKPLKNARVGVGLTAYNDEVAIGEAVKDFKKNVPGLTEVVVIDNNCTDRTAEVASRAGARVVREEKQGYGYACMRALKEARGDVIVLCEGDGTFSAADTKKFLAYMENADMVVGTRTVVEVLDPDSQVDWFINWGNKFIARMLQIRYWGKVRLSDVGCTYRAIRKDALERIMPQLNEGGNAFSPHMIGVALENDFRVIEVPVTFRQRIGESKGVGNRKVKGLMVGFKMLWHIFFK
ncbi:glycosyltransferase family 2 protein [Candidatus Micrarchaeota archaeon]|nr:MAG: glycosyltransferase family 2 protein [Candidatus Micrarchaeota archaeon]